MVEVVVDSEQFKNGFLYSFPEGNDKALLDKWQAAYLHWWCDTYPAANMRVSWMGSPKSAQTSLSQWWPHSIIEPAVCSPNPEVSRLTVKMQKLNFREVVLALAHPALSKHDLLDAEGLPEEELETYQRAQLRQGMSQEDIDRALEEARGMVRNRQQFVYPLPSR